MTEKTKADIAAEVKAKAKAEALTIAKDKSITEHTMVLHNGLRLTSGPVPDKCVRVLVLRNHDGNGPRTFYRAGEIVDVFRAYYEQQTTPLDEHGHKWTVKPAVFELVK
jgi:hypothetical protein